MKAYTDLEQSKKLTEILPTDSADAYYTVIDQGLFLEIKQGIEPSKEDIPCWSLAALADILRKDFEVCIIGYEKAWKCHVTNRKTLVTDWLLADNPIDCCYEMILKLYSNKEDKE